MYVILLPNNRTRYASDIIKIVQKNLTTEIMPGKCCPLTGFLMHIFEFQDCKLCILYSNIGVMLSIGAYHYICVGLLSRIFKSYSIGISHQCHHLGQLSIKLATHLSNLWISRNDYPVFVDSSCI